MRLDSYTKEMMDEYSFIDMSHIYLEDKGKETNLYEMTDKFKEIGNYTEGEIENRVLQFYTDLNTDGRFLSTDDGVWGLREWYAVDDISNKIAPTIHKIEIAAEEEYIEEEVDADYPGAKELGEEQEEIDDTLHGDDEEEEIDSKKADDEIAFDEKEKLEDDYDDEADAY